MGSRSTRRARPPAAARSLPPTPRCRRGSTSLMRTSSRPIWGRTLGELSLDTGELHGHGPGAPPHARRGVQRGRAGAAPGAAPQRGQPSAPPHHRRHDGAGLAGLPAWRDAHRIGDQRGAHAHLGGSRDGPVVRHLSGPRVAVRHLGARDLAARSTAYPTRSCGGPT